ncbi:MATE family efflux transporter [Roseburia yibonii]
MENNNKTELMTEGGIAKKIFFFSVPLILGNLLQQLYNTVDSIIVGNFVGSNALAAVGSSTSIICLLIAFSQGLAVGAGVIVSQYLGAKEKQGVQDAVHTAIALSAILGVIITVGGICFSSQLLRWMHTPAEVFDESALYLKLYFGGVIFSVLYNMAAGILNAAGNSRRSLLYLAVASVTNIVLDLVLIAGLHMGVAGAAVATDISQLVSCVLSLLFLMRVPADYQVSLGKIRVQKKMAARIITVGLPTGIQNMVISFSNVLVQSSVNGFGAAAMAGFGAYMKIDGFNILPVMSFSMAVTTFTGQNYGAGKIDRVKKGMWVTLAMGFVYTILTGVLLLTFADPLMRMFTKDAAVIAFGKQAMRYFCPFYFLLSIMHGLAGTVRGTGKSVPPMVILLTSLCLFRIIWIQFVLPLFSTIDGVFVLYPVSWAFGTVLMILYTWKGKWLVVKR